MTEPRHPTSSDEDLLEAETAAILSELSDEARLERIHEALQQGFATLAHVGKAVSIFGSAVTPAGHPQYEQARRVARMLGSAGCAIITGGGPGVMEAANRGAREAGVPSIGVDIELPHEQAMNPYVEIGLVFHYFFTRKVMFVRYASSFVAFPGGKGLVPASETGTDRGTDLKRVFALGQELKVAILDMEGGKLRLSVTGAARAEERADMEAWQKSQPKGTGGKGFGTFADLLKNRKA